MNTRHINYHINKWFFTFSLICLVLLLPLPLPVNAGEPAVIEITGDGVGNNLKLTPAELEGMEQRRHIYSTINTWPNKRWYVGKGVGLRDLFTLAEIKEDARLLVFTAEDGYSVSLTVKELLQDRRYYFPGLKDNHPHDGSIPGSPQGALQVEPILALYSVEGSDNPDHMTGRDALQLLFGQRAVTEQTNNLFLKHICKIEVLTAAPERWDRPRANIPDGTLVPEGTLLTLSNKFSNEDKIYYTTDGSTPTVESPIFNWSASRWWSLRDDLKSVNSPIQLNRDVVIKAITIGPGREDSEVITFSYRVDYSGKAEDPTKLTAGPPTGVTLDRSAIELKPGSTFQLEATVAPYNAADQNVTWSSSDTSVATVDTRGLVTVVGPGTATITVRTADGNHMAAVVINGPQGETIDQQNVTPGEEPAAEPAADLPAKGERPLEEKDGDGPGAKTEAPEREIPENNAENSTNASPLPDEKWRCLADKNELEAASAVNGTLGGEDGNNSRQVQVFQMVIDGADYTMFAVEKGNLDFYPAAAFIFLFLAGARKRYAEYTKEL